MNGPNLLRPIRGASLLPGDAGTSHAVCANDPLAELIPIELSDDLVAVLRHVTAANAASAVEVNC